MSNRFTFRDILWLHPGQGGWHFVTLPAGMSDDIKLISAGDTVGLGYVQVRVCVGRTIWDTTLFPSKDGKYYLAVKAAVRKAENLKDGDTICISFDLLTTNY